MNTLLKTITLAKGLYKISAIGSGSQASANDMLATPALFIAPIMHNDQVAATFLGRTRDFAMLSAEDSMTILHVHLPSVDLCIFSVTEGAAEPLDLKIDALAMKSESAPEPEPVSAPPEPSPAAASPSKKSDIDRRNHILMHLSGIGDAQVEIEHDLAPSQKPTAVEGFSLHFVSKGIPEAAVEYKALAINGAETPWVKNGAFCGSRGYGVPLIGLAMRPLSAGIECEYQVRFLSGALSAVVKNGMPLKSAVASDPISSITVKLTMRAAAARPVQGKASKPQPKPVAPLKAAKAPAKVVKPVKKAAPAKAAPKKAAKPPARKKAR